MSFLLPRDDDAPARTPGPRTGRSVYEQRFQPEPLPPDWPTRVVNIMGQRVRVPLCCRNPAECEREECWRPWP